MKNIETLINNLFIENFINNDDGFQRFCLVSLDALNKHAPHKKKHARGNKMSFFNKELSKAIMTRTKLHNIFLQNSSEENRIRYTKQINFCVSLLRKTKKILHIKIFLLVCSVFIIQYVYHVMNKYV